MRRSLQHFQDYITRIYSRPTESESDTVSDDSGNIVADDENGIGSPTDSNQISKGKLKIVIDWGALDIDRETQIISERNDSDSIMELLRALLETFGKSMKEQLTETPIIRFPLSTNPLNSFLNRAKGKPYSYTQIPGTDLYFCPHSQRTEKVERLRTLFSRLTLPDGSEFPANCIEVSLAADTEEHS